MLRLINHFVVRASVADANECDACGDQWSQKHDARDALCDQSDMLASEKAKELKDLTCRGHEQKPSNSGFPSGQPRHREKWNRQQWVHE